MSCGCARSPRRARRRVPAWTSSATRARPGRSRRTTRFRYSGPTSSASARRPTPRCSAPAPRPRAWAFARTSSAAAPTTRSTPSTGASNSRSFPARELRLGAFAQQPLQALLANAVEGLEVVDLGERPFGASGAKGAARRKNHLVLVRVLQRDELEHLGLVTCGFEQQRAQAVGHHLRFLSEVDAMAKQRPERRRARHLRAQFLVTAG